MLEIEEVEKKIAEYENFIENNLKHDLKDIEVILKDKSSKYNDWEDVKKAVKTLKEFKEKDRDMTIKFDIGNNILAMGEVCDYEHAYISIGLGYMLPMDYDEADKYADIRLRLLKKEIAHFQKLAIDVKVHIKMFLLAIDELQQSVLSLKNLRIK